ncbi:putative chromosome segregation ATPase SMC [Desulfuromonas soudanensis]|uniref:Putative chromosome segregation ATPase SMC n=1 Tax=Desulfuromonas soudanensis TaxID=1603606 RepID=A0A0M3QF11_9BACT|nr:AAA family ATPase [Desulfuromonas soudanensis]ALC15263.1 putative chromosome segregation ATPase SMC [Desulfuromonas soudanensis]
MFEFKFFEAVHWDFWERIALPFDGQLLTVVGPNGSGKTTMLDGLRTLLGIDCSSDRDYRRYVRRSNKPVAWLRAVVSNNKTARGLHSFHPCYTPVVTLVCRVKRKGGDWSREYAVLPGDVQIEEVEAKAGKSWYGQKDYRSLLERAGLGRAIRKVLTLEQGATDKLCTMKSRELLTLVFEAHGDQEILDKYQEAKNEQMTIQKEIEGLKQDLARLELDVDRNKNKVESYNDWKRRKEQLERLIFDDIPRLELLEQTEHARAGRLQLKSLRRELTKTLKDLEERQTHQQSIDRQLQDTTDELTYWDAEEKQRREARKDALSAVKELEKILAEKTRLEAVQRQQAQGFDPDKVTADKNGFEQHQADTINKIKLLEKDVKDALGRLTALRATHTKELPPSAKRIREGLAVKDIPHQFLSEVVEIVLPEWQPVIEGLISSEAFTVLLDRQQDKTAAWSLGEEQKYRGLVTTDRMKRPTPRPGSLLEAVEFHASVPSWIISRLDQTLRVEDAQAGAAFTTSQNWVSRKGYYRDARGGRYIAVDAKRDYLFGKAAVLAEIEDLDESVQKFQEDLHKLENLKSELNGKITDCTLLLEGWDADANLKARMAEFVQATNDFPNKETVLKEAEERLQEAVEAEKKAKKENDTFREASGKVGNQIQTMEKLAKETKDKIAARRKDIVTLISQYRQNRKKFALYQRTPALLQSIQVEYKSLAGANAKSKSLQEDLDNREWEKDPQVLIISQKLNSDYETKRAIIDQRREHHVRALTLTEQARGQYINVLYATLRSYIKSVRALGEMAGVEIIATLPKLENDDLCLAQAGLDVEFRFDQKETDETSGGQKVIKSLVLLVGLMMDKDEQSGGFVFIDEPFAHLDVLNINLVSNFLRRSGAQYVLTTPNTHNINVFEASDLTFVTRSWRAPAKWAPPVAWARRQEASDEVAV